MWQEKAFYNIGLEHALKYFIFFLFTGLSLYIAPYHELWADEAQAFLIARDADLGKILTVIPQQEGQPVLWQVLLKALILIFGNGLNITYVSIAVMCLCVGLIVFKYNISLLYKALIPFSYFFLYQYNIVARTYCLAYLALALIGLFYKERHKKIWPYTLSLALAAEATSYYVPVAATLGCFYLYEIYTFYRRDYKKYIAPLIVLIGIGGSIVWQVLPLNTFEYNRKIKIFNFFFVLDAFFTSKDGLISLLFLCFFAVWGIRRLIDFIRRVEKGSFHIASPYIYFIILWGVFMVSFALVCPNVQHLGLIFGLFLFSIYAFFEKATRQKSLFFAAILILQIYWGFAAMAYDKEFSVSPQDKILAFLRENKLDKQKILCIGYQTLPLSMRLSREQLMLDKDETVYYNFTLKDYDRKYNYRRLASLGQDIVVIDVIAYLHLKNVILKFFNPRYYDMYVSEAYLADKANLGYNQSLYLFVKKGLIGGDKI